MEERTDALRQETAVSYTSPNLFFRFPILSYPSARLLHGTFISSCLRNRLTMEHKIRTISESRMYAGTGVKAALDDSSLWAGIWGNLTKLYLREFTHQDSDLDQPRFPPPPPSLFAPQRDPLLSFFSCLSYIMATPERVERCYFHLVYNRGTSHNRPWRNARSQTSQEGGHIIYERIKGGATGSLFI